MITQSGMAKPGKVGCYTIIAVMTLVSNECGVHARGVGMVSQWNMDAAWTPVQ